MRVAACTSTTMEPNLGLNETIKTLFASSTAKPKVAGNFKLNFCFHHGVSLPVSIRKADRKEVGSFLSES